MTPEQQLYAIVEQGLCTGCGLCQAVAGKDTVQVVKTTTGFERPVVVGDLDQKTVDAIYDTCPGVRADGLPENLVEADTKVDNVWGPWRRMTKAWATDPIVRHKGSTGGVMSALGSYLLTNKLVDFVLHVKASTANPTFGEPHLSFTHADIMEGAGSRYGPTPPLLDIKSILDRGQTFAVMAKPCDITGLRNYARHDPRVDELVKYTVAMVCGGYGAPSTTEGFLSRIGMKMDELTSFRYRGFGCPGPTRAESKDKAVEAHYLDYWGDDESMWGLPFRCKVCPDGIGEACDIAVSDTWVGGSPNRTDSEIDPGANGVIARTLAGQALMEAAARDGALTIEQDITPVDMSIFQPHQMRKKYAVWARYQGLEDAGQMAPVTNRLRIEELAAELPEHVNEYQRTGTVERVKVGKATEPTPAPALTSS
jgi:coenzyme F420 hydrogenase subunit beta